MEEGQGLDKSIHHDRKSALKPFAELGEVTEFVKTHREPVDYAAIWEDAPALFVGERHNSIADKDEVILNLPDWQRQGLTHIAMEMFSEEHQPTLDAYFEGSTDRQAVLELLKEWDKGEGVIEKYMEMVDAIKSSGLRLLAVDLYTLSDKYFSTEFFRQRNENWARIIKQAIDENPQARVLVYDGQSHSNYNMVHDSANEILAAKGIKSKVIAFTGAEKLNHEPYNLQDKVTRSAEQIGIAQEKFGLRLDSAAPTRPADCVIHLPQTPPHNA